MRQIELRKKINVTEGNPMSLLTNASPSRKTSATTQPTENISIDGLRIAVSFVGDDDAS